MEETEIEQDAAFLASLNLIATTEISTYNHELDNFSSKSGAIGNCIVSDFVTIPLSTVICQVQENICEEELQYESTSSYLAQTYGNQEEENYVDSAENQNFDIENGHDPEVPTSDFDLCFASDKLYCPICDCSFARIENLVVHLKSIKHKNAIDDKNVRIAAYMYTSYHKHLIKHAAFLCTCCVFSPVNHKGFINHLKSQQHKENISLLTGPLECVNCNFLDYDGTSMLNHCLTLHHENLNKYGGCLKEKRSNIKCRFCDKVLHSTSHYSKHLLGHSSKVSVGDRSQRKCPLCDYHGKTNAVSQHIIRKHTSEKGFTCALCMSSYHFQYELSNHYNTRKHLNNVLDSYRSKICSSPSEFLDDAVNKKSMKCRFCPYQTGVISYLKNHYITHHEELSPIEEVDHSVLINQSSSVCRFCYCSVAPTDIFKHEIQHVKAHLDGEEVNVVSPKPNSECFICFSLIPSEQYDKHVLTHAIKTKVSTTPGLAKCKVNNKKAHNLNKAASPRSSVSNTDLKALLTGSNRFECAECKKTFPARKQLTAHYRTHQATATFHCDYCNFHCKTKYHLDRHKRIHADSKPYTCPYCEYSSTTIGNLRKHILSTKKHKGASMYCCVEDNCDFFSNTARDMQKHLSEKHNKHCSRFTVKSSENDWVDVMEGHSIIPIQEH